MGCLTFEQIHRDCYKSILGGGSYRFIRCPVNYLDERIGGCETDDDYYLCFNYHEKNGRYERSVYHKEFTKAYIGKEYYLVLLELPAGRTRVIEIYDGDLNLDETLSQMLARDAYLTGETIGYEEGARRDREQAEQSSVQLRAVWNAFKSSPDVLKFTPEEECTHEAEMKSFDRKAIRWLLMAAGMTVAFYLVVFCQSDAIQMFFENLRLRERFVYIVMWICCCLWPLCKYMISECRYVVIIMRMNTKYRKPVVRMILWGVTAIANLILGTVMFK